MLNSQEKTFLHNYNKIHGSNYNGVLLFDMDDVLAELNQKWIDLYNSLYNDTLRTQDIKSWNTVEYVKEECGLEIYELLRQEGLFRYLEPTAHSQSVIKDLTDNNFEIFLVTDSPEGHSHCVEKSHIGNPADDKRAWFREHFPTIKPKNIIFTSEKYLVQGNVLVDDKPQTYNIFKSIDRDILLMDRPYNQHITTTDRVMNMLDVKDKIYQKFSK